MKMRVYYFGVLLALFVPLGATSEPGERFAIDTLKEDLLEIKQLVGITLATPALDAVVVGAVEPGVEEIQAALQDAEACLTAAVQSITEDELLIYAGKIEAYWAQLFDVTEQELADESTRSRKCKKFCQLFAQRACIRNLKAQDVTILGTLILDGVTVTPDNFGISNRTLFDTTNSPNFDCLKFEKSRAGGAVQSGDTIGCILFEGFDGAAFQPGAEILAQVDAVPGIGSMPGRLLFETTPIGSTTPLQRMVINDAGLVSLTGSLDIPNTMSAAVGMFSKAGVPFLHNFGAQNTFLGINAGNLTMTGFSNTGIGASALASNTSGSLNTAVGALFAGAGFGTLDLNTTGIQNTAMGSVTLHFNTTGSNNCAFGVGALAGNTTGSNNSAFGTGALDTISASNLNVGFGRNAGRACP